MEIHNIPNGVLLKEVTIKPVGVRLRKKNGRIVMLILAILCMAGMASAAPTLTFSPSSLTLAPGATAPVSLILSEVPNGLAGYEVTMVTPTSLVTITDATFPSWGVLNRKTPVTGGYTVSAVDLNKEVQPGMTDIMLATMTVRGVSAGTATVRIEGLQMNADGGDEMSPSLGTLQVIVTGEPVTTTVPTTTPTPTATTTKGTTTTTTPTAETTTGTTTTTTPTVETTTGTTTEATPATTGSTAPGTATTTVVATIAPVVTATPGVLAGAPVAGFAALPPWGSAPLKVQFYDRSTGSPTSYEWDFGDGGTSMISAPEYTYRSEGKYTVKLTVTSSKGSSTVTQKDYIAVGNAYIPKVVTTATAADATAAPSAARTSAQNPVSRTQKPAGTRTTKAAAGSVTPIAGIIGVAVISVLLVKKENQ
jgi:hypothetical protein